MFENHLPPPRFLVCDNHEDPEREFVLHTHFPKFLAEATDQVDGSILIVPILWLEAGEVMDVGYNAKLMREMGDWFADEISSYEK